MSGFYIRALTITATKNALNLVSYRIVPLSKVFLFFVLLNFFISFIPDSNLLQQLCLDTRHAGVANPARTCTERVGVSGTAPVLR